MSQSREAILNTTSESNATAGPVGPHTDTLLSLSLTDISWTRSHRRNNSSGWGSRGGRQRNGTASAGVCKRGQGLQLLGHNQCTPGTEKPSTYLVVVKEEAICTPGGMSQLWRKGRAATHNHTRQETRQRRWDKLSRAVYSSSNCHYRKKRKFF